MKYLLPLFIFVFLSSCIAHSNNEIDKKEAEAIANKFYYYQETGFMKGIHKLLSQEFNTEEKRKPFEDLIVGTYYNYGKVKNFELDHWTTFTADGVLETGEYLLQYYVTREPKHTFENIYLVRENDSIKIAGYQVKIDGY
jgi:hypothetical protein